MKKKLVLGLDIGIASVGWSLLQKDLEDNFKRIIDLGVVTFSKLEDKDGKLENQQRREKRSMRRQRRRKVLRKKELQDLLLNFLELKLEDINHSKFQNVYELKLKGLNNKLCAEELYITLYHYMKYRGFQSTRKVDDKKSDGVILSKIEEMKDEMKGKTVTAVILDRFNNKPADLRRIHNTSNEYLFTISREMYLEEIELLLNKQIELNGCNEEFKQKFLTLYNRRRDFSEGPGKGSKFGSTGSFIEKMIGTCKYDGKLRAPKNSYSAQAFTLLSFLNNFRYKDNDLEKHYKKLTPEQIKLVFDLCKTKSTFTYNDIFKVTKLNFFRVKGLELSRNKYSEIKKEFISLNSNNELYDVSEDQTFKDRINKELLATKITVSLSFYNSVNSAFKKYLKENKDSSESINNFQKDFNNYDIVSYCLLTNKTDEKVKVFLEDKGFDEHIINTVATMPSISETINLSLDMCSDMIPHLLEGNDYESSLKCIGYDIHGINNVEKTEYLPEIKSALDKLNIILTNVNVKHSLVQVRKVINEVIKKYGSIDEYSVEFARELKKSHKDRMKMNSSMLDNKSKNDNVRVEIVNKYSNIFKSISHVKRDDIIRYKLFKEQRGMCVYSATMINERNLFNKNEYQIDHIIPYSRSYDDSYTNKVLVTTKSNQLKGNKLPKESSDIDIKNILKVINSSSISNKKRDKLLETEISDDFIERNINDTSYTAKLARTLIQSYLQPNKCHCPSGSITSKLKNMWRLSGYTHSLINSKYYNINTYIIENYTINEKKICIDFLIKEINKKETFELSLKNDGKEKYESDKNNNNMIKFFGVNTSLLEGLLNEYKGQSISLLLDNYSLISNDLNKEVFNEQLIIFFVNIKSFIEKSRNEKDRNNHLHHAIDATITACANEKMVKRVTSFYLNEKDNSYVDEQTGEVKLDLSKFPTPYKDFKNELILRVYERDNKVLLEKLNALELYNNILERRDVKTIVPVRIKDLSKSGAFTADTMFGMRNTIINGVSKNVITKRISVDGLDEKKIEKIVGDSKQNPIKKACLDWLSLGSNRPKYPYHPTRNNPIKTVLIIETENIESRVKIKENENRFATNASCISVCVYKSKDENDTKLYFVPIYYYQTISKNKDSVIYQMMWGQGSYNEFVTYKKLNECFTLLHTLPRYSVIEIEMISGDRGLCYTGGATSGYFEIYSILGDGIDLQKDNIVQSIKPRYQLTVSQIKSIKVRSVSILGNLN